MWGAVSVIMENVYQVGQSSRQENPVSDVSPVPRGSFGRIQTDISFRPQILKALYLNVFVPGVFRVPIKVIVIDRERARFSMAVSSVGQMRLMQKTWEPEYRHVKSVKVRDSPYS